MIRLSASGFHYFLVVNITNYANVSAGHGRRPRRKAVARGSAANGSTPTAGNDRNGVTAFLNSICKIDPSMHAGYTQI